MFRALCAHYQEVKIVLYNIYYHHTCKWPSGAQVERLLSQPAHTLRDSALNLCTGRPPAECNDTRCCVIQFDHLMMSTTVLETCRDM